MIANGSLITGYNLVNQELTLQCDEGYLFPNGRDIDYLKCQHSYRWSTYEHCYSKFIHLGNLCPSEHCPSTLHLAVPMQLL